MLNARLPSKLINTIMNCIGGGSCKLLWNDESIEPIHLTRGVRQGDPLSPYLFVLCIERLAHWIEEMKSSGA